MNKIMDWEIIQTLGEGAYGEVKLIVHPESGDAIAMKIIDCTKVKDAKECVIKEENIHRFLHHTNVIELFGKRLEGTTIYIFLEYAEGGELFNKIEPDVGMHPREAQEYMKQLLNGLEFLHSKGVVHRDIKPENLLLDARGVLKISDFGMATIFRHKGKVRMLDRKCGTLPYVAPEVLVKPYHAEPVDIWSSGIVLVAMLAGELPWDEPRDNCKEFSNWKKGSCITDSPWCKVSNLAFSLIRKILVPESSERLSISDIRRHNWMNAHLDIATVYKDEVDISKDSSEDNHNVSYSQPTSHLLPTTNIKNLLVKQDHLSFSQPVQNDDLILSQMLCTQNSCSQNNFHRLVKRMTRFFVSTDCEKTVEYLCSALDELHYPWTVDAAGVVTIQTVDNKKMPLTFKTNLIEMDGRILLDFRLRTGCGIEFKRRFLKIKNAMSNIIVKN